MTAPRPKQPVGEWISVTERLPERHQAVALLNVHRWENCNFDRNVQDAGYLNDWEGNLEQPYWSVRAEPALSLDAYTHWAPLPEPPK